MDLSEDELSFAGNGAEKYPCTVCEKTYASKKGLISHITVHMNVKKVQCLECELLYKSKSVKMVHFREVHKRENCQAQVQFQVPNLSPKSKSQFQVTNLSPKN